MENIMAGLRTLRITEWQDKKKWPICMMKINRTHMEVHDLKLRGSQIRVRQLTKFKDEIMVSCSDYQVVVSRHSDINHSFLVPFTTNATFSTMPENRRTHVEQVWRITPQYVDKSAQLLTIFFTKYVQIFNNIKQQA